MNNLSSALLKPLKICSIQRFLNDSPFTDEKSIYSGVSEDFQTESSVDNDTFSIYEDSCVAVPWEETRSTNSATQDVDKIQNTSADFSENDFLEIVDFEDQKDIINLYDLKKTNSLKPNSELESQNNELHTEESLNDLINKGENPEKINDASSSPIQKRKLSFENYYTMYCEKCEKAYEKVHGKKRSRCQVRSCRRELKYNCSNCSQRFKTYSRFCFHLKTNKCPGLPNFNPLLSIQKKKDFPKASSGDSSANAQHRVRTGTRSKEMKAALDAVSTSDMSLRKASVTFGIPFSTLHRAFKLSIHTAKEKNHSKSWSSKNLKSALNALKTGTLSVKKASKAFDIPPTVLYKIAKREGVKLGVFFPPIPPEVLDKALDAVRNGQISVCKAATKFGIPKKRLYIECKKRGIELNRSNLIPWSENAVKALEAIRSGQISVQKASSEFGIPRGTLYAKCKKEGIDLNRGPGTPKPISEDALRALEAIKSGQTSVQKASSEFGIPRGTLYAKCKKEGIDLNRGPGTPKPISEDALRALEAIKSGQTSVQKAANEFGIPRTTLYAKCKKEGIELSRSYSTQWSEDDMAEALEAVRMGQASMYQAAMLYNIPYSSLSKRFSRMNSRNRFSHELSQNETSQQTTQSATQTNSDKVSSQHAMPIPTQNNS